MNEQVVSCGFGKVNFSHASVSLAAFIVEPDFVRTTPSKLYQRQGQCQRFPASAYPEVNGYLYLDTVRVPDGVVLMLQSSHRHRGSGLRDGAVFLQLRSQGTLWSVNATLPSAREATIGTQFLVFQGRGDFLSLEELEAMQIVPPVHWTRAYLDPEEIAECYTIAEYGPALAAKPIFETLEDADGNVVRTAAKPGRQVRIRSRVPRVGDDV